MSCTPLGSKVNVVIGFFDGLHKGHQRLLQKALWSFTNVTVITFDTKPGVSNQTLLTPKYKEKVLLKNGVKQVITLNFNEIKDLDPREFIEQYLTPLNINKIFVGEDFKFGKNQEGTIDLLKEYYPVKVCGNKNYKGKKISSSWLRELIRVGNVKEYKELTGHSYFVYGKVVKGKGLATPLLNCPTANVDIENMMPIDGVYAAVIKHEGKKYKGIAIFSKSPTLTHNKISRLEVHLFNFDKTIYGDFLTIELIDRIRDIYILPTPRALKNQIQIDITKAKKILSKIII